MALDQHLRVHATPGPYRCAVPGCSKHYTQRNNLTRHHRLHAKDLPFVCGTCGKRFVARANLALHERVHSGDRPYVCPEPGCFHAAAHPSNLERHLDAHAGVRRYVCQVDLCDKRYARMDGLKKHIKSKHPGQTVSIAPSEAPSVARKT